MKKSIVLGIDIGGTNTVYGFIESGGSIILHEEIATHGSMPILDLVGRISEKANAFLSDNLDYSLIGIGIGAPNGNHYTGRIQDPPNLSWGDVDIVSIFAKHFNCEVVLTNDANAAALGEKNFGLAKNMKDFVVVTLGTGLGSGIFSSGKLLYGHDGFAGEMGHISIDYSGRLCNCGNHGCLESYASSSGIKTTVEELIIEHPSNKFLKSLAKEKIDGLLIDKAFDDGEKIARKIYEYTGEKLGQGLAIVSNLLSPEAFIFYGGFSNAGERILSSARTTMNQNLINASEGDIKLLQSGLPKGQAGILGAASLIWSK